MRLQLRVRCAFQWMPVLHWPKPIRPPLRPSEKTPHTTTFELAVAAARDFRSGLHAASLAQCRCRDVRSWTGIGGYAQLFPSPCQKPAQPDSGVSPPQKFKQDIGTELLEQRGGVEIIQFALAVHVRPLATSRKT